MQYNLSHIILLLSPLIHHNNTNYSFNSTVVLGTLTPTPEFNAEQDVEAYHIAVDNSAPDKVTIVPFSQVLTDLNISNVREQIQFY